LSLLVDGPRDLPDRQRTLRDTVAWSVDLLGSDDTDLFTKLAVFSGGFTLEAAEAVCTSERRAGSIVEGIATLVRMSLLTRENTVDADAMVGPRYLMLETVREFAVERLAKRHDADIVRDAHADWMMALTEEASARFVPRFRTPEAAVWLRRLTSEHENLRSALSWLEARERWDDLLRLTGAAVYFWELRLIPREGRTWLERALKPERTGGAPAHLRARATSGLGLLLLRFGDYAAAEANLEAARITYIALGDKDGAAFAQRMLAASAEYQGQDDLATERQLAALQLYRATEDLLGISAALDDLADGAYRRGDYEEAWRLASESVTTARVGESPVRLSCALATAGEAATARGDLGQATDLLREGWMLSQDMGFDLGIFETVAGMAAVATEAGAAELGARLLGAATALADVRGLTTIPHHALFRHTRSSLKEQLGEAAFVAAWEAGRILTPEQAVAEAFAVQWEMPATATPSEALSPREREIFRLLAAGQTNRAIGEELFISERTVDSHVSRIFRKLDVRTRAEAIAVGSAPGRAMASPSTPAGRKKHGSKARQTESGSILDPDGPQRI
jgi:DNA-binding CsgD family transcriptional regulator